MELKTNICNEIMMDTMPSPSTFHQCAELLHGKYATSRGMIKWRSLGKAQPDHRSTVYLRCVAVEDLEWYFEHAYAV